MNEARAKWYIIFPSHDNLRVKQVALKIKKGENAISVATKIAKKKNKPAWAVKSTSENQTLYWSFF
jgi:hypothetical protein